MDTNVQTVDQNTLVDLFPTIGNSLDQKLKPTFGQETLQDIDILNIKKSTTEETTLSTTEETTLSTTEETTLKGADVDILDTQNRKPAIPLKDLTSYFEDRVKSGKFIAVEQEDETGKKVPFIPTTPDEYDEVLELQISYRLEQAKQEMEKNWYQSKSPAWKVVSQYAQLVDNPAEMIPFIQGVQTIQSIANIDENEIDGAEQIVRTRLIQRGDPEEIVEQQIEALKTTDKLVSTAKQYKPIIIQQEQAVLANDMKIQQEEQSRYMQMVGDIRTAAIQELEQPIFGKNKLKQEEKAEIYDLIGEPDDKSQGYAIYSIIDSLYEKKDFKTLKEIALLLTKRESFYNYLGINIANQTAASLEKKLRLAGDAHKSSGNDFDEEQRQPIQRNQFKTKPTFGR